MLIYVSLFDAFWALLLYKFFIHLNSPQIASYNDDIFN